ncbi:hypothetical protein Tco_1498943 [Tanacetum coccineum]
MSKKVRTPRYLSLVVPLKKVSDEAIHKELDDRMERAAITASSLEAKQGIDSGSGPRCQDTILGDVNAQTRFEITSKQSNDPPLSRGYTLGSGEDSMELLELMEFYTQLSYKNRKSVLLSQKEMRDYMKVAFWNEIWVLLILTAAQLQLNAAKLNSKFAERHNVVAFLEKPVESDGFAEIIDFLKESSFHYALTGNPIIYTSCIEQFWATAKSSIKRELHLDDAEGTDCLPAATIFEELARMGYEKPSQKLTFYKAFFSPQWKYFIHTITQCLSAKSTAWNEFSSTMASLIICLATNQKFNLSKYVFDAMLGDMSHHKKIFVNPFHTKKVFANMKRAGKDLSRRITPLFDTMMVQASQEVGEDSDHLTNSTQIPIIDQPSTFSKPNKKQTSKKTQRQEAEVLDLEKAKDAQAKEIASLKKRVQRLEMKKKSRTTGLKRLKKVGMSRRVKSSEDQESLGDPEDASKQARSIADLDKDDDVTLVDETQERQDDESMFDTGVLDTDEMTVEAKIDEKDEQSTKLDDSTAGEAVTTASVEGNAAPTTIEEITLAQTLIQIKASVGN